MFAVITLICMLITVAAPTQRRSPYLLASPRVNSPVVEHPCLLQHGALLNAIKWRVFNCVAR